MKVNYKDKEYANNDSMQSDDLNINDDFDEINQENI